MTDSERPAERRAYILVISCPDTVGIVAAVAGFLSRHGAFIKESSHFGDFGTGRFFMRTVFLPAAENTRLPDFDKEFAPLAARFAMQWSLHDTSYKPKLLILVSKIDHCLNDLLYRASTGALAAEIVGVVSNHPDLEGVVGWHKIPFHYLPVNEANRGQQEDKILALVEKLKVDLVVLARYMQILSPEMCSALWGRAINIHHSFLPGFRGANPYMQAYAHGVKLIGATAHYVSANLDEGPIIEQAVERIDHSHTPHHLKAIGRDIENVVLARAVQYHIGQRVFINGGKTVVFR